MGENAVEQTLTQLRVLDDRPHARSTPSTAPRTLADLYRDHRQRMVRLAVLLVDGLFAAKGVARPADELLDVVLENLYRGLRPDGV